MIFLDGIIFSLQRHGGISVYFRELSLQVAAAGLPAQLGLERPMRGDALGLEHHGLSLHRPARSAERLRACRTPAGTRLFHSSYYRRPDLHAIPSVVTVHDFVHERYVKSARRFVHSWQKRRAIAQAQVVICISEATRRDFEHFIGARNGQVVHVVHNGVGEVFRRLPEHEAVQGHPELSSREGFKQKNMHRPFVLFVGERRGYKNFELLMRALPRLPELDVHCVGGGPLRPVELALLPEQVRHRVRHLGVLDDEALNRTYNSAACLVYPSAYEGFGIPVLEAMRAGCPVVCTPCAAVLEVGGSALTVAEAQPEALAQAVMLCFEPVHRESVRHEGFKVSQKFSWRQTHEKTLQIYKQCGI